MSKHRLRNHKSKTGMDSARRILESLDKKNRNKRLLSSRLANLQKVAVRFSSSFGPDLDAIEAFKKGQDYQGYVGKGKNRRLKFEVKDNKLFLLGHNIATKTKDGIKVSNAGFDTGLTYNTLKELGVNAKRTPEGRVILHNKEIDSESGEFVFVPNAEVSPEPIRATKKTDNTSRVPNRTTEEQSMFRKKVEERAMKEQGRGKGEIPLSETAIQPEDQKTINKITGVKSKIPKEQRGTAAHHIFPVSRAPALRNNPSQGVMLTRKEHAEVHRLNPNEGFKKLGKLRKQLLAARLRAFTHSSSFVGNMRYDNEEQSMTGILAGKHYKWCDVPERTFDSFEGAGSKGAFFNRVVKGQFDCGSGGILNEVKSRLSKLKMAESFRDRKLREQREWGDDGLDDYSKGEIITFDEEFTDDIPLPRVEGFSDKMVDTKVTGTTPEGKYLTTDEPVNVDKSIANMEEGSSALGEKIEDLRVNRKLLKERGEGETFMETFTRKFGAPMLNKQPAGPETKVGPYNQGTISRDLAKRLAKLQKTAGIKPLVRKKKKGRAIKKIAPRVAMVRTARHMSASELAAKFRSMTASNPDILKQNGTFDPLEGKIIDASTPEGAIRLQNIFESHGGKIGLNSITDTRQNIVTDMDLIESQLLEIEQAGGIPAIGVFDGSLEATNVLVDKTDDEIIANLGEAQRSTAIIDPDTKLRIVDNPRFKQN